MNLIFLNPLWLAALLPVILAGWHLLRAGRPSTALFTVPEFWPARSALASTPESHGRKAPDWPLVGMLLAAILAALALARPAWKMPARAQARMPQMHAVGRELQNQSAAQVFVRGDTATAERFFIRLVAGKTTLIRRVGTAKLARGIIFDSVPATAVINVFVRAEKSSGNRRFLTHITLFRHVTQQPLTVNSPSPLPRSLRHLLLSMHHIVWNHPQQLPAIWILSNTADRRRYQDFLRRLSPKPGGLVVVCIGAAAGPQMKVSGIVSLVPTDHPVVIQPDGFLFHRVHFSAIGIKRVYQGRFGSGWHAEIRAGSHVWLAKKTDSADGIIWYWMASPPVDRFTDWQHHASFVIFFANLIAGVPHHAADSGRAWWRANKHLGRVHARTARAGSPAPNTSEGLQPLNTALALISVIPLGLSLLGLASRKRHPA